MPKGEKLPMDDEGCMTPCMDFEGYVCGCADGGCATVEPVSGEEHKRRWVVYEVPKKTEETKKENLCVFRCAAALGEQNL